MAAARTRIGARAVLAITLTLACVATAHAQDGPTRARQLFEAGVAAMDRGSPGEAAGYFDQSYRLFPRASTACNMAVAQERLGRACDAVTWYRQCAALDQTGSVRDHANRQAAALGAQCRPGPVHDPFVRTPGPTSAPIMGGGGVRVVEAGGAQTTYAGPAPNHTLLGVGIGGLVLGGGALVGGIFSALEAQNQALQLPAEGGPITDGTPAADTYYRAATFSDLALGLYIGGGLIGALGLVLVIVDLAQPGVFGGRGALDPVGPRLAFAPLDGGGFAQLSLRF